MVAHQNHNSVGLYHVALDSDVGTPLIGILDLSDLAINSSTDEDVIPWSHHAGTSKRRLRRRGLKIRLSVLQSSGFVSLCLLNMRFIIQASYVFHFISFHFAAIK